MGLGQNDVGAENRGVGLRNRPAAIRGRACIPGRNLATSRASSRATRQKVRAAATGADSWRTQTFLAPGTAA